MRPDLFEESGRIKSYYAQFMTKQKPNPFLKKERFGFPFGAGDRDRTGTVLLPRDFKSLASANSATPATGIIIHADMSVVKNFPMINFWFCLFLTNYTCYGE